MIINSLDLGSAHPFAGPITGQVIGEIFIEGIEQSVWPRGSVPRTQAVTFWCKAWQAVGGSAAGTSTAVRYLLKQVEELASNAASQPVYIQWTTTADGTALYSAVDLHDGWYVINGFEPDYQRMVVMGIVRCQMTVTEVSPGAPHRISLGYTGGALSSNFSGTPANLISLPVVSTALEASFTRTAAEGAIPCILSPAASPEPFVPSTTIANIFKGGVHVYDTLNTGSNAVPTSGGTFVNANWVEVFYTDHVFVGDCVITNGLQLLIFVANAAKVADCYLWNTATAVTNWQLYGSLLYEDNANSIGTLRSYTLTRIGMEECSLVALSATSVAASQLALHTIRLQRGRYDVRVDARPLTQASTGSQSLALTLPAVPKTIFNSTAAADVVLSVTSPAFATDYGYGAAVINSTSFPFIAGFLYQNEPVTQPFDSGNSATIGLGDTTSLAAGASRSYGIFAVPYGVSGVYSPVQLMAEAESGTLSGGFVSTADAGSSGGNAAKLPNTTVAGAIQVSTTLGVLPAGTYLCIVRLRVTSIASGTATMSFGVYNVTGAAYTTSSRTGAAPSSYAITYASYSLGTAFTSNGTDTFQFRATNTATATTDWWIDEYFLIPLTFTGNTAPQQIWQQFMYDRSVRLVRP